MSSLHPPLIEHRDDLGSRMGMWIFLFTEMFFFGGLFIVYTVYRSIYPGEFHAAALHLNTVTGAINTCVLITSSLTVSLALAAMQSGKRNRALGLLGVTMALALLFLGNKLAEWDHKIITNLYPGSDLMLTLSHGYILYFGLYFFLTGLHALHLIIGFVLLTICFFRIQSGAINTDRNALLVNSSLYWHLVDLIWIFLFPLLYLIP
jgi:cytochrome c oxidase subunit 3